MHDLKKLKAIKTGNVFHGVPFLSFDGKQFGEMDVEEVVYTVDEQKKEGNQ